MTKTGALKRWILITLTVAPAYCAAAGSTPHAGEPRSSDLYVIQSRASDVRFLVYRAGLLAAFGHNHVIRATNIEGDVIARPDAFNASRFHLSMSVRDFRVDNHEDRQREGRDFAEQPSRRAVAATTHNMLSARVLDAAKYPAVTVQSAAISGSPQHAIVTARITLHGVQRDIKVPVKISQSGGKLQVTGKFEISQRDFGIEPYTALGGGLRVKNTVGVEFRILAARAGAE